MSDLCHQECGTSRVTHTSAPTSRPEHKLGSEPPSCPPGLPSRGHIGGRPDDWAVAQPSHCRECGAVWRRCGRCLRTPSPRPLLIPLAPQSPGHRLRGQSPHCVWARAGDSTAGAAPLSGSEPSVRGGVERSSLISVLGERRLQVQGSREECSRGGEAKGDASGRLWGYRRDLS